MTSWRFLSLFICSFEHVLTLLKVAGATLAVAPTLKSLGVILDQRLTFDDHATAVVKTCNFHIRLVRHLRPESSKFENSRSQNSRCGKCWRQKRFRGDLFSL